MLTIDPWKTKNGRQLNSQNVRAMLFQEEVGSDATDDHQANGVAGTPKMWWLLLPMIFRMHAVLLGQIDLF